MISPEPVPVADVQLVGQSSEVTSAAGPRPGGRSVVSVPQATRRSGATRAAGRSHEGRRFMARILTGVVSRRLILITSAKIDTCKRVTEGVPATSSRRRSENSYHRSHLAPAPSTGTGGRGNLPACARRPPSGWDCSSPSPRCSPPAPARRPTSGAASTATASSSTRGTAPALAGSPTGGSDGGVASGATGGWDQADGGTQQSRGGYHFIWIPYGAFGGIGTYAPGYVRSGAGGATHPGAATSGSVTRGGFGSTGAAHAGSTGSAHAGSTSAGS